MSDRADADGPASKSKPRVAHGQDGNAQRMRALVRMAMAVGFAASALVLLGLFDLRRHPPPQVLLSAGHAQDFVRAAERAIAAAKQRVWVAVYVMRLPDDGATDDPVQVLLNALVSAKQRGVDVRVCLDQSKDWEDPEVIDPKHEVPAAWLRDRGIPVLIDELTTTTHAKVILVDADTVFLGSHNWTGAALGRNREVSVVMHDHDVSEILERELFATIPGWEDLK
jgi:phosphatidylserine/phosphatidylglycerophosphate/cardiolipin synthase-like enzyme